MRMNKRVICGVVIPDEFPIELINLIESWDVVYKSPYGFSYYNSDKIGWNFKPDGSLRIADHWNFECQGKLHCQTTTECLNNTIWSVGKYNSELKKYEILFSIEK